MLDSIQQLLQQSEPTLIKAGLTALIAGLTFLFARLYRRYVYRTGAKHNFVERRTYSISKLGQTFIYLLSLGIISNVLGFGIQGIFVATSSFFAIVGIAFFANWSILSNITASVLIYFAFPFRIGDRVVVENEPKYTGTLRDINLLYLRIESDLGSTITVPANVAIQKIITIQSEADRKKVEEEELAERERA